MICHDSRDYRIEEHRRINPNIPFALDRKEYTEGHVCLVNLGWFPTLAAAHEAKCEDLFTRMDAHVCGKD